MLCVSEMTLLHSFRDACWQELVSVLLVALLKSLLPHLVWSPAVIFWYSFEV